MPSLVAIVNPASRDGRCGQAWPGIRERLTATGFEVEERITTAPGDAARFAAEAVDHLPAGSLVVAVGGDGVVHEVCSGLRGSSLVLGQIPFGSGNDFAITHGVPRNDLDGAIDVLTNGVDRPSGAWRLEAVPAEGGVGAYTVDPTPWDGEAEHEGRVVRWVFLETDAGITSAISRAKLSRARWLHGPIKYTWLGITTIPRWPRRKVEVTLDGGEAKVMDITMLASCTGETFGGGYRVCPGMSPHADAALVVIAPRLSRWKMLNLMGPVKRGKHVGKWGITAQHVRHMTLRPVDAEGRGVDRPNPLPTWIQADGEPVLQLPATLSWHPAQVMVRGAATVPWDSE